MMKPKAILRRSPVCLFFSWFGDFSGGLSGTPKLFGAIGGTMDRRRFLKTTGTCVAGAWGASRAAIAKPGTWLGKGESQYPPQDYGPWNRNLELFESGDGRAFRKIGVFIERGGVPSLARADDGSLWAVFQWFPLNDKNSFDQVACVVSRDFGLSWTKPAVVRVAGMPSNLYRVFDPTLIPLPGGGFRLYFSSERIDPENSRGNRAIFSAVSSDGLYYEFEPGQRFGFEAAETFDCAVAFLAGVWHLYCPNPNSESLGISCRVLERSGLRAPAGRFSFGNPPMAGERPPGMGPDFHSMDRGDRRDGSDFRRMASTGA